MGGDYGRIIKLLILTGQRRDEIGRLAWAEICASDGKPACQAGRRKAELDEAIAAARRERRVKEMTPWRIHDLRRTFVTMINEKRFALPHVVEAIINHVSGTKGGVAGVYNKALYLEERAQALIAWGQYVRDLVRRHSDQRTRSNPEEASIL